MTTTHFGCDLGGTKWGLRAYDRGVAGQLALADAGRVADAAFPERLSSAAERARIWSKQRHSVLAHFLFRAAASWKRWACLVRLFSDQLF
jgi:hypothetical protein